MSSSRSRRRRIVRRGRPRAADAPARIDKLLEIALRLFMQHGYNGTTVEEIARRADASKQTLYARFPTKARLFDEVMRRRGAARDALFAQILSSQDPIEISLERFGMAMSGIALDVKARALARTIIGESQAFPALARHYWAFGPARAQALLTDFLQRQVHAGVLASASPKTMASIFQSLCIGRFYQKGVLGILDANDRAERTAHVREAVRVFLTAYRRRKAPAPAVRPRSAEAALTAAGLNARRRRR